MRFEQIKEESAENFRRLTGIKRTTFDVMIRILKEAELALKAQGGKPNRLFMGSGVLCHQQVNK